MNTKERDRVEKSFIMKAKLLAILLLLPSVINAQVVGEGSTTPEGYPILSLRQCVQMAIDCSSDILQRRADSLSARIDLAASKYQFLPRIDAQLSQSLNLGRSEDASTMMTEHSATTTGINIAANYQLFGGMQRLGKLSEAKLFAQSAESALQSKKDAIATDILGMYYQVLMQEEMMKLTLANLEKTRSHLQYTQAMVKEGKWAAVKEVEIQAQLADEELQLIQKQNELFLTRLNLALNVDYSSADSLAIIVPNIEEKIAIAYEMLLPAEEIYRTAMSLSAEIRAINLRIEATKHAITTAQLGFLPTISLNAGYSTSYFYPFDDAQRALINDFSHQLKHNGRFFVGITLSLPIFDAMQTPTAIRNAKVRYTLAQIDHKRSREALNRSSITAKANAETAAKKIPAAQESVRITQEALRMTEASFEAGRSTSLELEQARNRALTAEMQLVYAKYDFVYKAAIVEFFIIGMDRLW